MKISHADITRALKAAISAGLTPSELRLSPAGEIRILFQSGDSQEVASSEQEIRDEIAAYFATPRY
ncbi:MAG: hypothetical protein E6Q40_08025 [Cupriavidus sp.]|nr:MAG: hypothetical protein E6Q40_08025 [Cupriavidus sp.]